MDEYDNDLSMDDHVNVDPWLEEESDDTPMDCIPDELLVRVNRLIILHQNQKHGLTLWLTTC